MEHISVHVREIEKARYRTRKGITSVNVLGVCDHNMKFVYVLPGWEGSVADSRVLRDALCRQNGFLEVVIIFATMGMLMQKVF